MKTAPTDGGSDGRETAQSLKRFLSVILVQLSVLSVLVMQAVEHSLR